MLSIVVGEPQNLRHYLAIAIIIKDYEMNSLVRNVTFFILHFYVQLLTFYIFYLQFTMYRERSKTQKTYRIN
jgi:hypothetical protein